MTCRPYRGYVIECTHGAVRVWKSGADKLTGYPVFATWCRPDAERWVDNVVAPEAKAGATSPTLNKN